MTIESLAETAVIADLNLDAQLSTYTPKHHDHDGKLGGDDPSTNPDVPTPAEQPVTIAVTAKDQGEFYKQATGWRKVSIEVEINANALADDVTATVLDQLAESASDRLRPSTTADDPNRREQSFSNSAFRVAVILANEPSPRTEADFIRTRHISRTFVCAVVG